VAEAGQGGLGIVERKLVRDGALSVFHPSNKPAKGGILL